MILAGDHLRVASLGDASGSDTNSRPSRCSWPRSSTTPPQGDRRRPGAGCGGTSRTTRRMSGSPPHPSRSSSASKKSPAGAGKHLYFVEHLAEFAPMVQILDALVPRMEDKDDVTDAVRRMDLSIAEQVIEVPKFIIDVIPSRSSVP